jgi:hypothetical protein
MGLYEKSYWDSDERSYQACSTSVKDSSTNEAVSPLYKKYLSQLERISEQSERGKVKNQTIKEGKK